MVKFNQRSSSRVQIADANAIRGQWKLGIAVKVFPGQDGHVRKVEVQLKNPKARETIKKYKGHGYLTMNRPVHKLVVILAKMKQTVLKNFY